MRIARCPYNLSTFTCNTAKVRYNEVLALLHHNVVRSFWRMKRLKVWTDYFLYKFKTKDFVKTDCTNFNLSTFPKSYSKIIWWILINFFKYTDNCAIIV